jgi:hypothetical protein
MIFAPQGRPEGSSRRWDPFRNRGVRGAGPDNVEEFGYTRKLPAFQQLVHLDDESRRRHLK